MMGSARRKMESERLGVCWVRVSDWGRVHRDLGAGSRNQEAERRKEEDG